MKREIFLINPIPNSFVRDLLPVTTLEGLSEAASIIVRIKKQPSINNLIFPYQSIRLVS
jgi:hypothetical protein